MLDRITQWLEQKDYIEGVRLYLEIGTDATLKQLFTAEQMTPYKQQRLVKALRALANGPEAPPPTPKVVEPIKHWPAESATDDILKALRADGIRKFKEMQDMRSQLMLLPDDQQRGEMAHAILRLDDELTAIFQKRDYYQQYGMLPAEKESEYLTDPISMAKRMETLQKYIRRERQAMRENPSNVGAAARKIKWIKEYNHYAEKFGRDKIQEAAEQGPTTQE